MVKFVPYLLYVKNKNEKPHLKLMFSVSTVYVNYAIKNDQNIRLQFILRPPRELLVRRDLVNVQADLCLERIHVLEKSLGLSHRPPDSAVDLAAEPGLERPIVVDSQREPGANVINKF